MVRHLWVVTVISFIALSWATAFLGAGTRDVIVGVEVTARRFGQVDPEYRYSENLIVVLSELDGTQASAKM
jgi:hypothetical protein